MCYGKSAPILSLCRSICSFMPPFYVPCFFNKSQVKSSCYFLNFIEQPIQEQDSNAGYIFQYISNIVALAPLLKIELTAHCDHKPRAACVFVRKFCQFQVHIYIYTNAQASPQKVKRRTPRGVSGLQRSQRARWGTEPRLYHDTEPHIYSENYPGLVTGSP